MLDEIFKAYDVRGIYGDTLKEEMVQRIGKAVVTFLQCKELLVGHDMRVSAPALSHAFMKGAVEMGCKVIHIGTVSTDCLYFAAGYLNKPGVMFTASHNPKEYNGIKFCKAGALPINFDTGLGQIKQIVAKDKYKQVSKRQGSITNKDVAKEFGEHIRNFVDPSGLKKLKIAADAGNGMAGKMVPLVYDKLPITIIPLYFELDGTFPNHPADPSKYENLRQLQKTVVNEKCDFGMAFDGDADRIFFVDEKGNVCNSSLISALIVKKLLGRHNNSVSNTKKANGSAVDNAGKGAIIYNVVVGRIVPETILSLGGVPIKERVGHSFIKDTMRKHKALFGCEHSAHYYYKDNYNADSGLVTSIIIAQIISDSGKRLSQLLDEFRKYHTIEETNATVTDKAAKMQEIKKIYEEKAKKIEEMDGISIDMGDWWFNVRPSNTEPLLRLNLEAVSEKLMNEKKEEILKLMKA